MTVAVLRLRWIPQVVRQQNVSFLLAWSRIDSHVCVQIVDLGMVVLSNTHTSQTRAQVWLGVTLQCCVRFILFSYRSVAMIGFLVGMNPPGCFLATCMHSSLARITGVSLLKGSDVSHSTLAGVLLRTPHYESIQSNAPGKSISCGCGSLASGDVETAASPEVLGGMLS